jgi:hypothetical protein
VGITSAPRSTTTQTTERMISLCMGFSHFEDLDRE